MLYEFLENYSITIRQYKTITCKKGKEPIVLITSNGYRELSGALWRRCNYLYISERSREKLIQILIYKVGVCESLAQAIAECLMKLRTMPIRKQPSISEAIDLARYLSKPPYLIKDYVIAALGIICKHPKDIPVMKKALENLALTYEEG